MPVPLKYPTVNWVNGMKMKKEHFIQQENAFEDKLKDTAGCFLTNYNYGLIPVRNNEESSFKAVFKVDKQKFLKVTLFQVRALTEGGARIEILENINPREFSVDLSTYIENSKKEESGIHYIVLSVDLFDRVPVGDLDGEEEPPRFPNSSPSYKITIFHEKEVARSGITPFSMFIGKMLVQPDRVEVFDDYIPSSMSLRSHPRLTLFHAGVEKFFNQMEIYLLSIIGKIKEKGQDSSLATSVLLLSENLLGYLNTTLLAVRWELPDRPPLHLFRNIATFARVMRNTIESNTAAQKEEMINYFTNWSELKQGDFEKLLVYCVNFGYDHRDISGSVDQFEEFIQIMTALFSKLESLAFIGKKKETNIFVKENTTKRSFLAD